MEIIDNWIHINHRGRKFPIYSLDHVHIVIYFPYIDDEISPEENYARYSEQWIACADKLWTLEELESRLPHINGVKKTHANLAAYVWDFEDGSTALASLSGDIVWDYTGDPLTSMLRYMREP
jgi:hypothetical protein